MKLSADKRSIRLEINGELDAIQLENLIADLAEKRAAMEPAVPMDRPKPGADTGLITMQDDPSVMAVPLKNGDVRFWLRSHGLGWLAFNFPKSRCEFLRDFFISNTTAEEHPWPSLFSDEGGDRSAH